MTPTPKAEIDIIGVVLRCGPSKYAGRTQNRCREVTIADDQRNQFLLTLWDDFGEIEGTELKAQMENGKEFPIILGKNIGVSGYQGLSLQTRFNSTIRINPTYPQALQLISWAKTNKNVLSGNVSANFAGSSTTVIVNPVHRQVISIAEIKSAASVGVFCIEAEMSISDDLQKFCVLECSGCKQKKCTKDRKQFDCAKCQRKTTLVPRCTFQIDLIDGSGSTTAFISGDPAEKLLSMKAEDIFYTTCVKNQLLCVDQTQQMLSNKLFYIQLRKSSWTSSPVTQSSLTILSYTEKEHVSLPSSSKRSIKKAKPLDANEVEMKATFVESESSSNAISIEPPTPIKKL
ncbi:replication protein A 70 kDa DNA-binding subunit B-like [Solanum stenotomum]|uniref:replication protein A 70 kDa DNA-binding subunit B-like n=1 Tax=Solanum stenotomum TaxID=172797 RepID=UPI0020D1929A|nr:replication protein A 70 kDa DNA-binding subunit B-like [Solanum stenotomum]